MERQRCPRCGSYDIRGGAMDTSDGDELQDRWCSRCNHSASWLRSVGTSESWWGPPPAPAPRAITDVERQLLAEIHAAPDDDAPRLVYADWLIERGDPLGTLIALQCARREPTPSADEQQLVDRHWRSWVGAPSELVMGPGVEFARGLWSAVDAFDPVAAVVLAANPALAADPAWGTVRRITIAPPLEPHLRTLLAGPLRRSVRRIRVWNRAALATLARWHEPLPLEELELWYEPERSAPSLPATFPSLPALRAMTFQCGTRRASRWLVAADAAGIRNVTVWMEHSPENVKKLVRRAKSLAVEHLTIQLHEQLAVRASRIAGTLAVRAFELPPSHVAPLDGLRLAKEWQRTLSVHLDPALVVRVPALTPEIVQRADELRLPLEKLAVPHGAARPRE